MAFVKSMPSKERSCLVNTLSPVAYNCVMGDYTCKTAESFLFTFKISCDDNIEYDVYSLERTYCECCDSDYSKNCIVQFEPTWRFVPPFTMAKFRLLYSDVDHLNKYRLNTTSTFYESNGEMFLTPLEIGGLIFTGLLLMLLGLSIITYGLFTFCKNQRAYRVIQEDIELTPTVND